jgi:hypothetical protein
VEDLEFIQDKYRTSLVQLHLLSQEEARCVFGEMDDLLKVHRSLRDNLSGLRDSAGITRNVGETLLNWVSVGNYAHNGLCENNCTLTQTIEAHFLVPLYFER